MNKEAVNHRVLCNEIITTQSIDTRIALHSRWLLKTAGTHTHTHTRTLQVARGVVTVAKLSQGNELVLVFRECPQRHPHPQRRRKSGLLEFISHYCMIIDIRGQKWWFQECVFLSVFRKGLLLHFSPGSHCLYPQPAVKKSKPIKRWWEGEVPLLSPSPTQSESAAATSVCSPRLVRLPSLICCNGILLWLDSQLCSPLTL